MKTKAQLMEELDSLVDQGSVYLVLDGLSEVCLEKAEHIRTGWQDEGLANRWESAGNKILAFSLKLTSGLCANTPGITE